MAALSLSFWVVLLVSIPLNLLVQRKRVGRSRLAIRGQGASGWIGGALLICSFTTGVLGPVMDAVGFHWRIPFLTNRADQVAGIVLGVVGAALARTAMWTMGGSWRIGVDSSERTDLVTSGIFRWSRNPIYTGLGMLTLGCALLVPNALSLLAIPLISVAFEIQVRLVEEPYLLTTHGQVYLEYAEQAGRFVPLVGRLRQRGAESRQGTSHSFSHADS